MPQTIKRTSNSFYLASDEDAVFNIYLRDGATFVLQSTVNYAAAQAYVFVDITEDGLYRIDSTPDGGSTTETLIPMYPTLISNIATEFKSFVCDDCADYLKDCGCGDLKKESIAALKYNNLASKILTLEAGVTMGYSDADRANYQTFIYELLQTISCKAESLLAKILAEECLRGISQNTELYALTVIARFWGLYQLEKSNTLNFEDTPIFAEEAESPLVDMYELFLYEDWFECLCNTCLRVDEGTTIFESGVVIPDPTPTNLPPLGGNLFYQIESNTDYYNYDLNQAIFNTVFSDDNDAFPTAIKIVGLPAVFTLEDTSDVAVTLNQVINWGDIANYRINHTISGFPRLTDFFTYRFVDSEGAESPAYTFTFALFRAINNPPNVIADFSKNLLRGGSVIINTNDFFNVGTVTDTEGDQITHVKAVSADGVTLERWNGVAWVVLALEEEIDITGVASFADLIRATDTGVGFGVVPTINFAFKDENGSNTWSNDSVIGNVQTASMVIVNVTKLTFTGGIATDIKTEKNWIPIARIEYSGDYRDLTVENIVQSGYVSSTVPYLIKPATEDTPWSTYSNSGALVESNTTNPTLNTFDIYVFTDVLNDRDFTYEIHENGTKVLDVVTTFSVNAISDETPIKIGFLEFTETDIADFDALETPAGWPADPNTIWLSEVGVTYDEAIEGVDYDIVTPGLIGFALYTNVVRNPTIFDSLGNDVTTTVFKRFFNAEAGIELFISRNVYAPSTLYLDFDF